MKKRKPPFYIESPSTQKWYCTVHKREATHLFFGMGFGPHFHCDPSLGGITISCRCVPISSPDGSALSESLVNFYKTQS